MDEILKQIAGSGIDQKELQKLMGQINGQVAEGEGEEEPLEEDEKMENVRLTYDFFIQNQLKYTSHTIEWLPQSHLDPSDSNFDVHYFLMGTHIERLEEESVTSNSLQDKL